MKDRVLMMMGPLAAAVVLCLSQPEPAVAQLALSVSASKTAFSTDENVPVSITLKNISSGPVIVPLIDSTTQSTYVSVGLKDQSGVSGFFVSAYALDDPAPGLPATDTQMLPSGGSLVFNTLLNNGGVGPLGYKVPGDVTSLTLLSGQLTVTAQFVVNSQNKPTGGDPGVFMGVVNSTDSGPPLAVDAVLKQSGDLNADGKVDCLDIAVVKAAFGKRAGQQGYDLRADINDDGVVDVRDLAIVSQKLPAGTRCQ
jgi:hypothetical protein